MKKDKKHKAKPKKKQDVKASDGGPSSLTLEDLEYLKKMKKKYTPKKKQNINYKITGEEKFHEELATLDTIKGEHPNWPGWEEDKPKPKSFDKVEFIFALSICMGLVGLRLLKCFPTWALFSLCLVILTPPTLKYFNDKKGG